MIKLKNILFEGRSKGFDLESAVEFYNKFCSEHAEFNGKIYRGIKRTNFDYGYVNPSDYTRTSTMAGDRGNAYTVLMDNLPSWSDYPDRSRSIICTTDKKQAHTYGELYYVIPVDGGNVGICPDNDIWYSFDEGFEEIGYSKDRHMAIITLNDVIKILYGVLTGNWEIHDQSYSALVNQLNELTERIVEVQEKYEEHMNQKNILPTMRKEKAGEFIPDIKKYGFFNLIKKVMDPKTNNFQLKKYKRAFNVQGHKELWTDAKSLLISEPEYENFIETVSQ